jgi:hypothetical protein
MILLEAIDEGLRVDWSSSLDPEDQAELDRLRADGHAVDREGPRYTVSVTAPSARNTQLYRTLLHEIGHWFDWLEKVEAPAHRGEVYNDLADFYFARPAAEREAFAHRYAEKIYRQLVQLGSIPFEPASRE